MSLPGDCQKQVTRNRIVTTRSSQPCKGLFLLLPKVRDAHWEEGKEAGRGDKDEREERCFMGTRGKGWCSGKLDLGMIWSLLVHNPLMNQWLHF